jgi:SecD/SecF fusion protein
MPRATFSQIVNRSMSEVLTRSLVTSFSTLLPIMALLFFGGATLKDFGFALLVGVASGTYSSIFIASPVLTHWKEREPLYQRRRRVVMEDNDGVVPAYAEGTLAAEEEPAAAPGRRRAGRAPTRPTPAAAKPEPAGEGAATAVREPPPEPKPKPAPAAAPDGGDGRGGDGDPQSAQDSVRAKAEERRRQRRQQRKGHGRR